MHFLAHTCKNFQRQVKEFLSGVLLEARGMQGETFHKMCNKPQRNLIRNEIEHKACTLVSKFSPKFTPFLKFLPFIVSTASSFLALACGKHSFSV